MASAPDSSAAERLRGHLEAVRALRGVARADPALDARRSALRAWQAKRLERTYPDLLASPRYGAAAAFFLSDLYGPKDVTARDEGLARILPTLARVLPEAALDAMARAVELEALSERLDLAVVERLGASALAITDAAYADAYRAAASREDRDRQIDLIGEIGATLDRLAHKPLIAGAVRMMEAPARRAGLGALHDFLARGLAAFRHMRGAREFLATVDRRERLVNDRLYAGHSGPVTVGISDVGQMV